MWPLRTPHLLYSATLLRPRCGFGLRQPGSHVMNDIASNQLYLLGFPFAIVIAIAVLVLGIRAVVRYVLVTRAQRKKPEDHT